MIPALSPISPPVIPPAYVPDVNILVKVKIKLEATAKVNVAELTDEFIGGNWQIITDKNKVEVISGDSTIEIRKDYISNIHGMECSTVTGESYKSVSEILLNLLTVVVN